MKTSWIDLTVGAQTMPCYVAEPDQPAKAGVIVIQEIFGVNEPMVKLTELVASAGYLAIAPAIFHRTDPNFQAEYSAPGFAKGLGAAATVTFEGATADLEAASAYLRSQLGEHAKLATWGFCFGGSMALLSATIPGVDAALSFYGGQIVHSQLPTRPPVLTLVPQVHAPLFFAFGGKDEHITADDRAAIEAALGAAGKAYEMHVYPDEDHGFFRHGPGANAGSGEVWLEVQRFLSEHLAPSV